MPSTDLSAFERWSKKLASEIMMLILPKLSAFDVVGMYYHTKNPRILDAYENIFRAICHRNKIPIRSQSPSSAFIWYALGGWDMSAKFADDNLGNLRRFFDVNVHIQLYLTPQNEIKIRGMEVSSAIQSTIKISLFRGMNGSLKKHFEIETNFCPEVCLRGKYVYYMDTIERGLRINRIDLLAKEDPAHISSIHFDEEATPFCLEASEDHVFAIYFAMNDFHVTCINVKTKEMASMLMTEEPIGKYINQYQWHTHAIGNELILMKDDGMKIYKMDDRGMTEGFRSTGKNSFPTMIDNKGYIYIDNKNSCLRYISATGGSSFRIPFSSKTPNRPVVESANFFTIGNNKFYIDQYGITNITSFIKRKKFIMN